jgi:Molecular chaperone
MRVGLDFGTTNSSAAIYDGDSLTILPLDPINANPNIMRSTLFMTREGVPFIGREAINRFIEGNVGREIEYEWRYLGETELVTETGVIMQSMYTQVDANTPGRLFQSLKSGLRDSAFTKTNVFGTYYTLEALIATVLELIKKRIEEITQKEITSMVLGRPVHYAFDPDADALAFRRMQDACKLAGLPDVTFLPEPTAAALAYARTAEGKQNILVFDFGGGTLDVTVMRLSGTGEREVLSTSGVPIGGDVLDQRIVMGRMLNHFGAEATLGPRRLPFPTHILDHLSEWQTITDLTQPRYLQIIDEAIITGNKPKELRALRSLVRKNYGLTMFEAVERAKVELSSNEQATISLHLEDIDIDEVVPRWDFERLIGPDVRAVEACIDEALAAAGLKPQDINVVLRTGGSSRIPRFVNMLSAKFGPQALREMDVFSGVASGLAVAAWERN